MVKITYTIKEINGGTDYAYYALMSAHNFCTATFDTERQAHEYAATKGLNVIYRTSDDED